jgi:hypothetical protein
MGGWREVKRIVSQDGKQTLYILEGDTAFRYDELRWRDGREDELDEGYWDCEHSSGLYESADAAERDARLAVPWLRGEMPA